MQRTFLRLSVYQYLAHLGPARPYELVFGVPRATPTAPCPHESTIMDRLMHSLIHLRGTAGDPVAAMRAPVDLVLDAENGLVLHPAIVGVRRSRGGVRAERQVWRPPALVVELLWPGCSRHVRNIKVRWYRNYGAEECWLIDTRSARIEVLDFAGGSRFVPHLFGGKMPIQSRVYPDASFRATDIFAGVVDRPLSCGRVR